jgi:hypothetical protein
MQYEYAPGAPTPPAFIAGFREPSIVEKLAMKVLIT